MVPVLQIFCLHPLKKQEMTFISGTIPFMPLVKAMQKKEHLKKIGKSRIWEAAPRG
jgi:hypothetical protein